jgi:hypothetical protein
MSRLFELLNARSGNLVSVHNSQEEALATVHASLVQHGEEYVSRLVLGKVVNAEDFEPIAAGDELITMARAVPATPRWTSDDPRRAVLTDSRRRIPA